MSLENLFEKLDARDPGSLVIDFMDAFLKANTAVSEFEKNALRVCVETAKWSANRHPDIAERYCKELGWVPEDLAVMMVMQCAAVSVTSGEFMKTPGNLTDQGEGFRGVWERCLRSLIASGRIDDQIAEIERRELQADIDETDPA